MSIRRREHRHGRSYKGLHIDCGLPEAEWIPLMDEVKEAVRDPVNSVVLEDPKHNDCWETWLDDFIDCGIGERFFGAGMNKKWDFRVDRAAVRTFMRLLVLLVVSRRRTTNRRSIHSESQRGDLMAAATVAVTSTLVEGQIQGESGKRGAEYIDEEKVEKICKSELSMDRDKTKEAENAVYGDITLPSYNLANKLPNAELIFQTRLLGSNKVKFLYTNDATSLQLFLGEVHSKFGLGQGQGIESFEAQIGNKIYVIDSPDERDWQQIIKIVRGVPYTAEIVAKVVEL